MAGGRSLILPEIVPFINCKKFYPEWAGRIRESVNSFLKMRSLQPALLAELPRLSLAPFLLELSSPGDVTLAPRVPSTFDKTHSICGFLYSHGYENCAIFFGRKS